MHGGHALHGSGLTGGVAASLSAAVLMAVVVPAYTFFVIRTRLAVHDAAAVAATYGSVSAVTFITAGAFLTHAGIGFGGHMVAALALMESPAIVVGVLLLRVFGPARGPGAAGLGHVLRDACFNGSVVLILGSLVIGYVSGEKGWVSMAPFTDGIFKGMLSFFLLDMGLVAARRWRDLHSHGWWLPVFSVAAPLVNAMIAIGLARVLALPVGDALLFAVLSASASYIAVPAALRLTIPEANPTLYVSMALAFTFPFNIVVGLPLYLSIIRLLWS